MVSSDSQHSPTVLRAAVLQAQLNAMEPEVFSLQGFQAMTQQQQQQVQQEQVEARQPSDEQQQQQQGNVVAAGSGCRFTLAPLKQQGLSLGSATTAPDWQQVQVRARVHFASLHVMGVLLRCRASDLLCDGCDDPGSAATTQTFGCSNYNAHPRTTRR
jgi:TolA-binding protein